MDGFRDYQTKWSKSDKDKYHMCNLRLKADTSEPTYKTGRDSHI